MISKFSLSIIKILFESTYNLTGRHFALYDADYNLILEYPNKRCEFCDLLYRDNKMNRRCVRSIEDAMHQSKNTGKTAICRCHAELIEISVPVKDEHEKTIAYIIFGQLLYKDNIENQYNKVRVHAGDIACDADIFNDALQSVDKVDRAYLIDVVKIITHSIQSVIYEHALKYKQIDVWYKMNEYIYMNFDKNVSLKEMAARLSVSVPTLCKTAKQYSGKTVGQLIADKRIDKTKYYLENTVESIAAISKRVGIDDYSYFSRFFKKHTGMTPNDWRNKFASV